MRLIIKHLITHIVSGFSYKEAAKKIIDLFFLYIQLVIKFMKNTTIKSALPWASYEARYFLNGRPQRRLKVNYEGVNFSVAPENHEATLNQTGKKEG